VVVVGVAVRYDDLGDGTSDADRLLAKKYYEDVVVENFLPAADFVFVARE